MSGSGATITLDGVAYSVDSTKLSTATNDFVSHLGTISGEGTKIKVGNVEYSIDSTKLAGAISGLQTGFGELENGGSGGSDSVVGTWLFNEIIEVPNKNFAVVFNCKGERYIEIGVSDAIYYSIDYGDDTQSVYNFDSTSQGIGWQEEMYRTITIAEQPTDSEFIAWLKANATKTIIGTWVFNDTIEIPSKNFEVLFNCYGNEYVAIEVVDEEDIYYSVEVGDETDPAYFFGSGWENESFRTINVTVQPDDPEFIEWLNANAKFYAGGSGVVNIDGYIFYTNNGVNYLVGYSGANTELVLPNYYNGENYEIKDSAFRACTSITSVVIPDSVTSIGDDAFFLCHNLTSVTLGKSVTSIGSYAFSGCTSLTSVVIPDSVTSIGYDAFSGCTKLTSVVIPNSVTNINKWAFSYCGLLTNITFNGTIAQWNAITKGEYWNLNVPDTYVQCTDGIVLFSGEIIPNDSNSVAGMWVFNEEITTVLDVLDTPEKLIEWDNNGCYHDLVGYVITPDGNNPLGGGIECILANGELYGDVYDNFIRLADSSDSLEYSSDDGWYTSRKIIITEEPSVEVAAWIRANATKIA